MIELNKNNFQKEALESAIPVITDFWADWCGPCKALAPTLEKVSKDYEGKIKFCKANVAENQELTQKYEIRGIPCLIFFFDGKELDRLSGSVSEQTLRNKINEWLGKVKK